MTDREKSIILSAVGLGRKGNEVITEVAEFIRHENICVLLEELVAEGELVEIEYCSPEHPYRIKSFYLPKGSKVVTIRYGTVRET